MLWLSHVGAFALRAAVQASEDKAASGPSELAARLSSRRRFMKKFANAAAFATIATAISPRLAFATCGDGCLVGRVSCKNHLTYKCYQSGDCTIWILTGNAC